MCAYITVKYDGEHPYTSTGSELYGIAMIIMALQCHKVPY